MFIEDDETAGSTGVLEFDRNLQSLIHLPDFKYARGIVIGRFQLATKATQENLSFIIKTKKELNNIPVIANADFGHTNQMITFPIGGTAKISAGEKSKIIILKH